ncbi:amidase [Alphaproteobacteria bacterium]|nr:amidase [Alphaproteobacteria bacterium]
MAGFTEYEDYDGLGLAGLVKSGQVSATEVLDAAVERVEARNPAVNAVVAKLYDHGKKQIADGLPDGAFKGVPFLLKDLGSALAGTKTTRGSRYFADLPPMLQDSLHVARIKAAGMVIFGKTNTCELGLSLTCEPQLHGTSRNPWDLTRTPSGSSGGASAAVGARMLPISHASDGFGSIRGPAAACGLVGLRPTRARNTQWPYAGEGMMGYSIEHAVSLSVRDNAALLDATQGGGPGDPYVAPPPARPFLEEIGADPGQLRIAFTEKAPNGALVEADYLRVLQETVTLCEAMGHAVEQADPEVDGEAIVPTFRTISAVNALNAIRSHPSGKPPTPGDLEIVVANTVKWAESLDAATLMNATQTAHRIGRQMAAFFGDYDVLLTPALGTLPPKLGWIDMMMEDLDEYWRRVFHFSPFTVWFNTTGQPAMMIPLGLNADGFPIAVQAVARYGDEATLFRLASQLEAARPWFDRKPALVSE